MDTEDTNQSNDHQDDAEPMDQDKKDDDQEEEEEEDPDLKIDESKKKPKREPKKTAKKSSKPPPAPFKKREQTGGPPIPPTPKNQRQFVFKAVLEEAIVLRNIIEAMKDIIENANFNFGTNGIDMEAASADGAAMIKLSLNAEGFPEYNCESNQVIGINMKAIHKIVKTAEKDDRVTLQAEDDPEVLVITFKTKKTGKTSTYDLRLMNVEVNPLNIPAHTWPVEISMTSAAFKKIIDDMVKLGAEKIKISILDQDNVNFSFNSHFQDGSVTCGPAENPEESVYILFNKKIRPSQEYAARYLKLFTNATPLSPEISIQIEDGFPAAITYKMNQNGYIRFYAGARFEGED